MELRKFVYKSYHSKPKIKLKKILDDDLFFKRALILKMALNKNIKINTNYRIERFKTDKNISNSKKQENSDDSFENKKYDEIQRKKNLLNELENILDNNTKQTEKFVQSFKGLKEENNKFLTSYDDIKIPVEERIKKFIINTMKLFKDNKIEINFRTKQNNNSSMVDKNDDLNDLWAQNNAAIKLFKQCPLTLHGEREIYFYYIANYLGEKLNINDHKYIKFLNQIREYLDDLKNDKTSESSPPTTKERKNKRHNSQIYNDKKLIKNNDKSSKKDKNKKDKKDKKENLIQNIKKINLNKVRSSKIILDAHNKLTNNNNNISKKETFTSYKHKKNEINNSKMNKSDNFNNISNIESKNKNSSRGGVNSTQENPSKDTVNLAGISTYEKKNKNKNANNNIYNIYKNNVLKNKKKELSCATPNNKNLSHVINNLQMKKKIYLNTCNNRQNKNIEDLKAKEELNKCKSTKKFHFNSTAKNSLQETNYTVHKIPSDNLSNIKKNSISRIIMKKQISPINVNNFENIDLLSRNNNKRATMNLFRYINDIKINGENNEIINIFRNKNKKNIKTGQHSDQLKVTKTEENEISPIKPKNSNNLLNLYEKAKNNSYLTHGDNLKEINEYLKSKGINNDDILKRIQFNSDIAFINLKTQTNKLNIEAKTKAFFHGVIPNERKEKLEQLRELNTKINQIEREYIKTLIDKDLKFKK